MRSPKINQPIGRQLEVDAKHRPDVIELALGDGSDVHILVENRCDALRTLGCRTIIEHARSVIEMVLLDLLDDRLRHTLGLLASLLGGQRLGLGRCRLGGNSSRNANGSRQATTIIASCLELVNVDEAIVLIGATFALDRKSTRLNSSHSSVSRMPSSA